MAFPAGTLAFSGESIVHTMIQDDGRRSERNFCPSCGGLVFGGVRGKADQHTVYAGSLDDPSHFKPTIAIFNSQRPEWAPLPPGLKVFEKMPG